MTRDPAHFVSPAQFDPMRHLTGEPEKDPSTLVFGFGRRYCLFHRLFPTVTHTNQLMLASCKGMLRSALRTGCYFRYSGLRTLCV